MTLCEVCACLYDWFRVCGGGYVAVSQTMCFCMRGADVLQRRSLGSGHAVASKPCGACHRAVRVWGNPCMCASESMSISQVHVEG